MWIDDQVLKRCAARVAIESWVPERSCVVLGRSNQASREVNVSHCETDGIPILKRLGGGGTVLLYPGCLVISVGCWVSDYYKNDRYFRQLNQAVIDTIRSSLPALSFDQRGYSDIVIHDKKCVGTSLFRSRNYLLYQASLLIDLDVAAIERYLAHPSAEPDYRKGRRHRDFLCGLREHTPLSPQQWREIFVRELEPHLEETLRHDLIDPRVDQMPHLHSRMGEMHPLG